MSAERSVFNIVKFKTLCEQLTDEEFDTFLSEFWRKISRKEVLRLLCSQYLPRSKADTQLDAREDMINITSKIIQSRDPDMKPSTNVQQELTLKSLPCSIIGEIASYQDQKSYARFSRINRKIFVDSNSPNRLTRFQFFRNMHRDIKVVLSRHHDTK